MKNSHGAVAWLTARFNGVEAAADAGEDGSSEAPLRAELFSGEQMAQHGKTLAAGHVLGNVAVQDPLLLRLGDNERLLVDTCGLLTTAVQSKQRIAPAGEWLLDNFYLIEEQIRTARQHLPRGYSRELPRLAQGPSRGMPRVYDLALEAISHGDGRIDAETLGLFVDAYQTVTPLKLGELWAIPITLRLALIENLRRIGARIRAARQDINLAQDWANRMMTTAESDPKSLIVVIADMARSQPPMVGPFVAELTRRLQGHGPALALPLTWIEQRLAASSKTIGQMVLAENQQQAADQVSVSNTIGSLRLLMAIDWRDFVEHTSLVEQTLRLDLGGVYGAMDFASRDRYRHVIDRLARHSDQSEVEIARTALALSAVESPGVGSGAATDHVGYYLIDRGVPLLEQAVAARLPLRTRIGRRCAQSPLVLYLGSIALLTVLFTAGLLLQVEGDGITGWPLLLLGVLTLLATSQLAASLTNWLSALLTTPRRLPRMDYAHGLPPTARTLVVIPSLIGDAAAIDSLIETLEVQFLGNQDAQLHFALLTDFPDAPQATRAEDPALLQQIGDGIDRLNDKYRDSGHGGFFLLHRPRRWNPSERLWMGYERKRGKLADLNAALRDHDWAAFSVIHGAIEALSAVRYVITLDTDTRMPRDAARQFVGTMAHPLHRPQYDEARQRITAGYGILQPSMAASLSESSLSRYAQLCGSEPGIDPYTRSVSDVYQDLFGEGSFIGKGIYDVDAFERALKGRFPENRILSHDLLEGCYARSGLISDVHLYEGHPSRYPADVARHRRWIRGDWQIAHWLLPYVPGADGHSVVNPLSALSRWKIFDNLRRTLASIALTLLLLLGWTLLPQPQLWTLAVIGIILIPPLLISLLDVFRKPEDIRSLPYLQGVLRATGRSFALSGFRIASLVYEAYFGLNAFLRTAWRMLVVHRGLLEWNASPSGAAAEGATGSNAWLMSYRIMWIAPFAAFSATALTLGRDRSAAFAAAAPILLLWLAAPAIACWLSRPLRRHAVSLTPDQWLFLRRSARRTWAFFEQFVVAADHWLPPDNFQEHPGPVVAHRTSPTNIGLTLLANLSAWDLGFICAGRLIERSTKTFEVLAQLQRYKGHFYNWYDTATLMPLSPRYVSSVDSGNLAGHLMTLRAGLLALPDQPVLSPRLFDGLADTLGVLEEVLVQDLPQRAEAPIGGSIATLSASLAAHCAQSPQTLAATVQALQSLAGQAAIVSTALDAAPDDDSADDSHHWVEAFERLCADALAELALLTRAATTDHADLPVPTLRQLAADGSTAAAARIAVIEQRARDAGGFAAMEYEFLYDRDRRLLAVGYNVDEFRRDNSYYDLLASEARMTSFVAIAQDKLPQECWFALGRLRTTAGGAPALLSWSGSMFEYLMPLLVMPDYDGSLLHQTCRAAVMRQIAYGQQRNLPWGVSECGYNLLDANLSYQYHAFGVPGLGLKHGLGDDAVVAPYASALALMVAPDEACINLQRLTVAGLQGRFGFYEAIDYTPSRQTQSPSSGGAGDGGHEGTIVRSYMAHHQGMTLLSLTHLLRDRPMQRRFESDPQVQATLLLLQEQIPKTAVFHSRISEQLNTGTTEAVTTSVQAPIGADTATPEVQLLSNGHYHVMVSNTGGGYSRWHDLALTRWREDSTRDNWGNFIYLRDTASGEFWSTTYQPTLKIADSYAAMFSHGRAEFRRRDHGIEAYTEVVVSPEDNIELRRLRLTNRSRMRRCIEITSYAEVALATPAADAMQPAFGKLFVQTEIVEMQRAIVCTRRPRSQGEATPWLFHLLTPNGSPIGEVSFETDRMCFVGRGRSLTAPQAMIQTDILSGSAGSVLDPVFAIRCNVTLEAGQTATIDWVTGASDNREACMALVGKYQDRHLADRVFELAHTHNGVTLRQINASEFDAQTYRRLAGPVIYANAALRAEPGLIQQNRRGQSGLWGYAISGDLPIVLLKIADASHIELARQLIQCHAWWRMKGLAVDLVIWNEDHAGYRQQLQDQIMGLISTGTEAQAIDRPGGIFVRNAEQISQEDRILLQAVARVIVSDARGNLLDQVSRRGSIEPNITALVTSRSHRPEPPAEADPLRGLQLANGHGGFSADGREYVINTAQAHRTPAPWVNVLANPDFGSVVSESGIAYTWSENAHEFRLTPWSDDAIGASGGEALYLRDEESGHYWSPTPWPSSGAMPYRCRHGFGYSVFEHTTGGIHSELWVYVDLKESVKFSVLRIRNGSGRTRRLSATGYVEWVLGDLRDKTAMHLITEIDAASGALFARNAYNTEFAGRTAFFDVDATTRTLSGDRSEFLGRNGSLEAPEAMRRLHLSGRLGAALDPCGVIQVPFELADGQEREIIFRLGAGRDPQQARALAQRLRVPGSARAALEQLQTYWQKALGTVQVETPDVPLNLLANGWLIYQVLACRLWARSGYYQSGGAFGFRDQLQDVMALVHAEPRLVRDHLLRSAARQFPAGDVQHWWHPPTGRGVRTRCSDDYLWLPLAISRYVTTTGDTGVLNERVHFLDGRDLAAEEESYYDRPGRSDEAVSLYQHGVRAIEHGLRFGAHGLPLMGSGDWNDGMNLVGIKGRGESVWLGFFLYDVLKCYAGIAVLQGDRSFAAHCETQATRLRDHLDQHAWDGGWYRRAWFDDGTLLGSATNPECSIDSIAQSWAVLSGAGDEARNRTAMQALDQRLVQPDAEHGGLIQLLDPPFDQSLMNPGYIKGYVPGVRENGGQYTHAAVWAAMAFAALGDSHRAWTLQAMVNPINHSSTAQQVAVYRTEPYAVAADVYALTPHTGRGGWTWYTGSAGWLYRLMTESLLGLQRQGERLRLTPCIPQHWKRYRIDYRHGNTPYAITVTRALDTIGRRLSLDDTLQDGDSIVLVDDGQSHTVELQLGTTSPGAATRPTPPSSAEMAAS